MKQLVIAVVLEAQYREYRRKNYRQHWSRWTWYREIAPIPLVHAILADFA